MSIYEWSELLSLWQRDKLTPEQAIGQLFLHLQNAEDTADKNKRNLDQLIQQVAMLEQRLDALDHRSV